MSSQRVRHSEFRSHGRHPTAILTTYPEGARSGVGAVPPSDGAPPPQNQPGHSSTTEQVPPRQNKSTTEQVPQQEEPPIIKTSSTSAGPPKPPTPPASGSSLPYSAKNIQSSAASSAAAARSDSDTSDVILFHHVNRVKPDFDSHLHGGSTSQSDSATQTHLTQTTPARTVEVHHTPLGSGGAGSARSSKSGSEGGGKKVSLVLEPPSILKLAPSATAGSSSNSRANSQAPAQPFRSGSGAKTTDNLERYDAAHSNSKKNLRTAGTTRFYPEPADDEDTPMSDGTASRIFSILTGSAAKLKDEF